MPEGIHDVARRKSRLIEEWKHFNPMINRSLMKQLGSGVHVFKLAGEHAGNILNTNYKYI